MPKIHYQKCRECENGGSEKRPKCIPSNYHTINRVNSIIRTTLAAKAAKTFSLFKFIKIMNEKKRNSFCLELSLPQLPQMITALLAITLPS